MRRFSAVLWAAVIVLVVAIGRATESAAQTETPQAVPDITYFNNRVFAPGVQGTIRITGTGWVDGTTFSFTSTVSPGPINVDNVSITNGGTRVTVLITPAVDARGTFNMYAQAPGEANTLIATVAVRTPKGTFNPITPTRVLDTRIGTGGRLGALGPGESMTLRVTGIPGLVPAANVDAVTLNLTAVEPTAPGYLTVYPT